MDDEAAENYHLEIDEVDGKKFVKKVEKKISKCIFGGSPSSLISGHWKDDMYSMEYKIKSQCHIFCHKNFSLSVGFKSIEETELDTILLEETFKALKFDVFKYEDYKSNEIRRVINKVSEELPMKSGCLVCCFLSYGNQAQLYAADGVYDIESVLTPFSNSLPGKPKVFIFQIKEPNYGIDPSRESTDSGFFGMGKRYYSKKIPFYSDLLIALSTFSDSFTLENGRKVSNFIRLLCHALKKHSQTYDMLTILTFVNSNLVRSCESPESEESFHYSSTLTRLLKLE